MLLVFMAMLLVAERTARSHRRFASTGRKHAPPPLIGLTGLPALIAVLTCGLPVLLGFFLPLLIMIDLHMEGGDEFLTHRFLDLATNSLVVAAVGSLIITALAWIIAFSLRTAAGVSRRGLLRLSTLGYALPGTLIAVGVLTPLGSLDRALNDMALALSGQTLGLVFSGSVLALFFAYVVRFLAVAAHTLEAGLEKVPHSLDYVARTQGFRPMQVLAKVHAPLLWRSGLTAMILVFADILKELPATLIVRPFNFDTLAIRVYQLASDERLAQASTAAIFIILISLVPVALLSRSMDRVS